MVGIRRRLLLAAACIAGCGDGDPLQPVVANDVLMLTQRPRLEWYLRDRFRGRLEVDESGCLRMAVAPPGNATIVWPSGTTLWTGSGDFVVRNAFGVDEHTVGDPVTFVGGYVSSLEEFSELSRGQRDSVRARCPGPYWLVTPGTVVG